jgi:hypothetical protein
VECQLERLLPGQRHPVRFGCVSLDLRDHLGLVLGADLESAVATEYPLHNAQERTEGRLAAGKVRVGERMTGRWS